MSAQLILTSDPERDSVPIALMLIEGACIAIEPELIVSSAPPTVTITDSGVTTTLVVPTVIETIVGVATCTPVEFSAIV